MKRILSTTLILMAFMTGYSQMYNSGGTITVENGATLVIEGDYTSTSSGVIEIDGNVQLKGDFINNSGSISSGSTGGLAFNGTSLQEITGTQGTIFYCGVTVNNTAGVALTNTATGADQVFNGLLTFSSGDLTLNGFDLTLNGGFTGADVTKHVVTSGAGELKQPVGSTNVIFPVGDGTNYNPLVLNEAGTSDTYGVIFTPSLPGSWAGTDHAVVANWTVTEANAGGANLSVTPQWATSQQQPSFNNTDCAVGVTTDDGLTVAWKASGAAAGANPWTRTGTGFTGVGKFMVGDYFFEGIDLDLDLFLAGPYSGGTMSTALKTAGLIPLKSPYNPLDSVFTIPANVVDWIKVELRDQTTPATVVKSYSFFVDNNGNVLNLDGTIGTKLTGVSKIPYYVAVRHRNHLGVMTASPIDFATAGPFAFNFSTGAGIYGTNAMRNISGVYVLWLGNTNNNNTIVYVGAGTDTGPISTKVILAPGNTTFSKTFVVNNVYDITDVNLDGKVVYIGTGSDANPISTAVILHPANTTFSKTYAINQQLP